MLAQARLLLSSWAPLGSLGQAMGARFSLGACRAGPQAPCWRRVTATGWTAPRCRPCCWFYCHLGKNLNGATCGLQVFVSASGLGVPPWPSLSALSVIAPLGLVVPEGARGAEGAGQGSRHVWGLRLFHGHPQGLQVLKPEGSPWCILPFSVVPYWGRSRGGAWGLRHGVPGRMPLPQGLAWRSVWGLWDPHVPQLTERHVV